MKQGTVIDNIDPKGRYRVKINIASLHDTGDGIWCEDVLERSSQGDTPEIDTMVWCEISDNEPSLGFYFGYVKY